MEPEDLERIFYELRSCGYEINKANEIVYYVEGPGFSSYIGGDDEEAWEKLLSVDELAERNHQQLETLEETIERKKGEPPIKE